MNAFVIKSWKASPQPFDGEGTQVSITGRAGGLLSWLLSLVGVSPTILFSVNQNSVVLEKGSWGGMVKRVVPLDKISSSYYGYRKPWKEALVFGLLTSVTVIGPIIAIIYYFLDKTLTIAVTEDSGVVDEIEFKRSVLDKQNIDENQAQIVCAIIQSLIDQKLSGGLPPRGISGPAIASAPQVAALASSAAPAATQCPKCGANYPGAHRGEFCEQCGTKM
jgi:hypothetical protein